MSKELLPYPQPHAPQDPNTPKEGTSHAVDLAYLFDITAATDQIAPGIDSYKSFSFLPPNLMSTFEKNKNTSLPNLKITALFGKAKCDLAEHYIKKILL